MKPIAKAHGQSYGETGGVGIPEGQQECLTKEVPVGTVLGGICPLWASQSHPGYCVYRAQFRGLLPQRAYEGNYGWCCGNHWVILYYADEGSKELGTRQARKNDDRKVNIDRK